MSRFGAGIRRGVMAADQLTQIANRLFRDAKLSYKAKGIFGYISTHRDGWQITITDLATVGPDGKQAIRVALKELEHCGYLIRQRLRRADGTLGEIVYSITDQPTMLDATPGKVPPALAAPVADGDTELAAGVRRGVMAADQFTQIANGLFRDGRLSFKAKGLFGYVSTHRDGWRMTVADLARRGRDGAAAVTSGLKELEKHGFLLRERLRNRDGTLGPAAYCITDLPAIQNSRSQPESGYPPVDKPTLAHRPTKNTMSKKTNKQNTRPLPPCAHDTATRIPGRTDQPHPPTAPAPAPPADEMHPGIRLLLQIGASRPELLLTGKALTDQGRVITVMLEAGWSAEQLRHVFTDRPLPSPVRTSVGAIIAARLRAAQAYPPPATAAGHPDPLRPTEPLTEPATEQSWVERSSTKAAARTVDKALTYRALVECAGCGVPGTAPGEDLCPTCLGWPPCRTCPGPTPRRAHPDGDGRCTTCATALSHSVQVST
ncbi:hypothetical protein ACF052_32860 [Streptomyces pilosus]|uniref:hypothetical protein n=1 Tax=Streptomyces pilosus TaxID=28893 RepID=UPI0036FE904B